MGEGEQTLVIYLDMAFLLSALADWLALYVTARLSGLPVRRRRVLAASALGGAYGALCMVPTLQAGAGFFPQLAMAALLVWVAFGRRGAFLRQFLLFFMISCTMGGVFMAAVRLFQESGGIEVLKMLNWKVFFLTGGVCYLILSVVFRGSARHAVAGQLYGGRVVFRGRGASITVLLDTGHTLTDSATGRPVLTAYWAALEPLWTAEERETLSHLEEKGAVWCLERLAGVSPGLFHILPYRAVGIGAGLLLCFHSDGAVLAGKDLGAVTVALSPTEVSDGGGYTALWGGGMEGEERHAA